uniref:Very late factor 1 n=1 Tax=Phthorimaea operculella granulovirus TaxID=192584 RepID=A0A1B2CS72_9BBAC|nr:very late factor 1 [Phthorimaea operculella granulovirus]QBH65934.1 very late factor 1 [Phthorimaea operculella granulovirus]QBH66194.1 very late factor 1 [Phthorimaea operculella granulovirus]QBH66324.1 very late factor 1 [Phthorimaea operculella granulovirus]QBH66454.1 very late factor 1 [Phthorimaea operculella granulovirus]
MMEDAQAPMKRTMDNYNIWRLVIKKHPLFCRVFKETVERQKRELPIEVEGAKKKNLWLPLKKEQQYKDSTIMEFQSLFMKIVYCLIDNESLDNYGWYTLDREMESLLEARTLMDIEDFIERLLELGGINKKRMQATINYYTHSLKLPDYRIPSGVELPRDRERRKRLAENKTIDLKDDFIDPVHDYIENEIQHRNYYTNQSLMRAAIVFNIIRGTGLRITSAYKIKLDDLEKVYEKGEHKVLDLITKHSKVDFCYVKCINKRSLKTALELYRKVPADALNKISSKSPTRFQDMKLLINKVNEWRKQRGDKYNKKSFTSNMIRNFVADSMLNKGVSMNKTSKLMNHASVSATRHYVNKFHPGPSLVHDDHSSSDNEEESIVS